MPWLRNRKTGKREWQSGEDWERMKEQTKKWRYPVTEIFDVVQEDDGKRPERVKVDIRKPVVPIEIELTAQATEAAAPQKKRSTKKN